MSMLSKRNNDKKLSPQKTAQTQAEQKLVQKMDEWFEVAEKNRQKQEIRWRENEKIFANKMSHKYEFSKTRCKIRIPLAHVYIRAQKGIIRDYLPTIETYPTNRAAAEVADLQQKKIQQLLADSDFITKLMGAVTNALIYSNGDLSVEHTFIDIKMPDGTTSQELHLVFSNNVIQTVYPAPDAAGINYRTGECRYIIYAVPKYVDEIKAKTGKDVPAEGYLDDQKIFTIVNRENGDDSDKADMALWKECYWMDLTKKEGKLSYPHGRRVEWANGILIKDEPVHKGVTLKNGRYKPGNGHFWFKNNGFPNDVYGVGEPEFLQTINKAMDAGVSDIGESLARAGNPVKLVSREWYNNNAKMRDIPGEYIIWDTRGDVDIKPGVNVPASAFQFIQMLRMFSELVTGVPPVSMGEQDSASDSGFKVQRLQEAANMIIRDKIAESIEPVIIEIGKYILFLLEAYEEKPSQVEISEGEFVDYNPEDMREASFKVVSGVPYKEGDIATEERLMANVERGVVTPEYAIPYMSSLPDKKAAMEDYKLRQSVEVEKQQIELYQKALEDFEKLVLKLLGLLEPKGEDGQLSKKEQVELTFTMDDMANIVKRFPELMNTLAWSEIPKQKQDQLTSVFLTDSGVENV